MLKVFKLLLFFAVGSMVAVPSAYAQFSSSDPCYAYRNYTPSVSVSWFRPAHGEEVSGLVAPSVSSSLEHPSYIPYTCRYRSTNIERTYTMSGGPLNQTVTDVNGKIDTSNLEPGSYRITARVTYNVYKYVNPSYRNVPYTGTAIRTVNVIRDTTPPQLQITYPIQGQTIRGIARFKANATDASGIRDLHFIAGNRDLGIYESSSEDIQFDTRLFPDGILLLQVRAVDNQNIPVTASITVDVDNIDDDPEVGFVNLVDNQSVSGLINVRTNTFDDRGIEYVKFYVDGVEVNTDFAAPFDGLVDTEQYKNGPHQVAAIATDTKGETTSASITLVFQNGDFKDPIAQITSFSEGARVSGVIDFAAKAKDESGIEKVEFFIGTTLLDTITIPPYQVSFDTEDLPNGIYNFGIVVYDKAGNFNTDSVVLVVENGDDLNASVYITKPSPNTTLSGIAEVEALAVDNVAIREVRFLLDDKLIGATKFSPYTFLFDTNGYPNGNYILTVQAYGYTNNFGEESIPVRIQNTAGSGFFTGEDVNNVTPQSLVRGYSRQLATQIEFLAHRRSLSGDMMSEHKAAFQDLMDEMMKAVKAGKRMLKADRKTKKVPRFAKKARKSLRRALRKGMKQRALNRTRNKLNRIVKAFE